MSELRHDVLAVWEPCSYPLFCSVSNVEGHGHHRATGRPAISVEDVLAIVEDLRLRRSVAEHRPRTPESYRQEGELNMLNAVRAAIQKTIRS